MYFRFVPLSLMTISLLNCVKRVYFDFWPICSELEYTQYLGLDIWIGTWNVNGRVLENAIYPWLFAGGQGNVFSFALSNKQTDLFVVGLQEMVDLTATTVVSESQSVRRAQVWIDAISAVLNKSVRFLCSIRSRETTTTIAWLPSF